MTFIRSAFVLFVVFQMDGCFIRADQELSSTDEYHDPSYPHPEQHFSEEHHDYHEPHHENNGEDEHYDSEGRHNDDYDHEAVIGSREQAEEFKELTPEESAHRLALLVDQMDTNKDGRVDKAELKQWIMNSFQKLDHEKAKDKLEEADENEDHQVTWVEYLHRNFGYKENEIEAMRHDNSSESAVFLAALDEEKEKFDLADVNKNGLLDLDEFVAFRYPQHFRHMAPYEIQQVMRDYDLNKDTFIDEAEYLGDTSKFNAATVEAEKKAFAELDANKDGKLDSVEVLAWVMPGYEKIAAKEVDHLFHETDKDKDEALTKVEIMEQHNLWVGSSATDHGGHLDAVEDTHVKSEL